MLNKEGEEAQRLVGGETPEFRKRSWCSARQRLVAALVGLAVALVVVAGAVAAGVLLTRVRAEGGSGIPVLQWGDCAQWLNGTEGGFEPPDDGRPYDACAQLTYCRAGPPGRFGYRMHGGGGACLSPGPTLRLRDSVRYGLVLCVDADVGQPTNLHTHGLHIPGTGNGDDVTREVEPGQCIFYQYELPPEVSAGAAF